MIFHFHALVIQRNIRITASTNGWMTGDKVRDWLDCVWGEDQDDHRRLLVLDQARIHTMQTTQDHAETKNTDVTFIPGGCTSICQPADVCWNAVFKRLVREQWSIWRRREMRTQAGNLKLATRQDVINWISEAWKGVSEVLVRKSFKCCGISNELNGSEDHLFSNNLTRALNAVPPNDSASSSDTNSDNDYDGETDNYEYSEDEGLSD